MVEWLIQYGEVAKGLKDVDLLAMFFRSLYLVHAEASSNPGYHLSINLSCYSLPTCYFLHFCLVDN